MPKSWDKVGAWALETERAEEAEARERDETNFSIAPPTVLAGEPLQSFPSLKEAATKPKKKKGVTFTLSEFTTGINVGPVNARRCFDSKGLTIDEKLRLPTGPRELASNELEHFRFDGGFRSNGYGGPAPPRNQPSRADEVDNWSSVTKPFAIDSHRQVRSGSLGESKADEVENWRLGKRSVAPTCKPRVNPFGNAKPREVLLEEKGMDWRKIDQELEHRRIDRPETDEEKKLKEEIDNLKKKLGKETEGNMNGDSTPLPTEQYDSLLGQIRKSEKELENVIRELDDMVRFGKRSFADSRPGSRSGRAPFSADKPPVQTGFSEDSSQAEFVKRLRSRGTGDSWSRPVIEKQRFRSSRDSGFLVSRSMDWSKSGARW